MIHCTIRIITFLSFLCVSFDMLATTLRLKSFHSVPTRVLFPNIYCHHKKLVDYHFLFFTLTHHSRMTSRYSRTPSNTAPLTSYGRTVAGRSTIPQSNPGPSSRARSLSDEDESEPESGGSSVHSGDGAGAQEEEGNKRYTDDNDSKYTQLRDRL